MSVKKQNVWGTHEWGKHTFNCITGCGNDCLYGYCQEMAVRFGQVAPGTWKNEVVRQHDLDKSIKKYDERVMYPSSHDIRPEHLQENLLFLQHILDAGNEVLIVSKPHLVCIKAICKRFPQFKDKILFRFTIGSSDDEVLKFWEPGAPSFKERFESLKWSYKHGFATSVSCEPMIDNNIEKVIKKVSPFVTEKIWIGKMNRLIGVTGRGRLDFNGHNDPATLAKARELIAWQSDAEILRLFQKYQQNEQIMWKASIKQVLKKHNIINNLESSKGGENNGE